MLALIVSEHHCDWQQHCLVLGPGETLPERILLLPARRYQQEVNYSDMFTPATTKRNQRRSPLAAQNCRLTDGRTVRSAIWRRQSTHRPPRACPLPQRLTQVLPPRVLVMNTAHYYQNTVLHNEPQLLPAIGEGRV